VINKFKEEGINRPKVVFTSWLRSWHTTFVAIKGALEVTQKFVEIKSAPTIDIQFKERPKTLEVGSKMENKLSVIPLRESQPSDNLTKILSFYLNYELLSEGYPKLVGFSDFTFLLRCSLP